MQSLQRRRRHRCVRHTDTTDRIYNVYYNMRVQYYTCTVHDACYTPHLENKTHAMTSRPVFIIFDPVRTARR